MTDLSETITPKSDQLNADDLNIGPRTITVTKITAQPSSTDQPVSVYFEGDNGKPFKPCKSMRRVLVHLWGNDGNRYVGQSMTLYRDPDVMFGGIKVGGIRISHASGIDAPVTMPLTASRTKRVAYTVKPLSSQQRTGAAQTSMEPAQRNSVLANARDIAKQGLQALREHFGTLDAASREAFKSIQPELLKIAADADNANDEDPFGADVLNEQENPPATSVDAIKAQASGNPATPPHTDTTPEPDQVTAFIDRMKAATTQADLDSVWGEVQQVIDDLPAAKVTDLSIIYGRREDILSETQAAE